MAKTKLVVDTDEVVSRAVSMRKYKMPHGTTVSDVVNGLLRDALADEIREVESMGIPPPPEADTVPVPPKKRGRPRKTPDAGGEARR